MIHTGGCPSVAVLLKQLIMPPWLSIRWPDKEAHKTVSILSHGGAKNGSLTEDERRVNERTVYRAVRAQDGGLALLLVRHERHILHVSRLPLLGELCRVQSLW